MPFYLWFITKEHGGKEEHDEQAVNEGVVLEKETKELEVLDLTRKKKLKSSNNIRPLKVREVSPPRSIEEFEWMNKRERER